MVILADLAAGACALLFLGAVLGKLDRWNDWSHLTAEMPGPAAVRRIVRAAVPTIEATIVVISFMFPVAGLAMAAMVLAVFAVAVQVLARRLAGRDCNCFGAIAPATISPRLAGRNLVLAILAAGGWYLTSQKGLGAMPPSGVLLTLVVGAIALLVFQYGQLRQAPLPPSSTPKEVL